MSPQSRRKRSGAARRVHQGKILPPLKMGDGRGQELTRRCQVIGLAVIGLGCLIVALPNLVDRALGVRGFGKTIEEEAFRQITPPLAHREIGGGGKELVAVRVITERLDQEFEGGIQAKIGESRRHP